MNSKQKLGLTISGFTAMAVIVNLVTVLMTTPAPSAAVTIAPKDHEACRAAVTWPHNDPAFAPECYEV